MLLEDALNNRKDFAPDDVIDEKSEYIIDILNTTVASDLYMGLITGSTNDTDIFNFVWFVYKRNEKPAIKKLQLKRDGLDLQGYVLHSNIKDEAQLFTLCKYIIVYYATCM